MIEVVEEYLKSVSQKQFLKDIEKADCLHLVEGIKIKKERPKIFKNRYEAINFLNEKYEVTPYEITEHHEAIEFWDDLCTLSNMGKIEEKDFNLASQAMGYDYL